MGKDKIGESKMLNMGMLYSELLWGENGSKISNINNNPLGSFSANRNLF